MTSTNSEQEAALIESLGTIHLGRSRPVLSELTSELGALFDCGATSYRALPESFGWGLEFLHVHGRELDGIVRLLGSCLAGMSMRYGAYNPLCPEPAQRNRVLGADEMAQMAATRPALVRQLYEPLGLQLRSHMRVLVCDGPFLLTWLGLWREEAFDLEEERSFGRVALALRERLRVDRILNHGCSLEATALALEAVVAAAFWVRANGTIQFANAAGRLLFDRNRAQLVNLVREAVAVPNGQLPRDVSVFPLASDGVAMGALVIIRDAAASLRAGLKPATTDGTVGRAFEARLLEVRARWRLTPRHVSVVKLLARGDSNKDIAAKLGLSTGTVEVYLTEIFRRAKVDSRLQLVAKLWE